MPSRSAIVHRKEIVSSTKEFLASGAGYLAASVVFVQGATYIAQLAIAKIFGPSDFAIVRTVESVLAAALTAAQCGLPSLAIRGMATLDSDQRNEFIGRLIATSFFSAVLAVFILHFFAEIFASIGEGVWLQMLAPTLVFAVSGRVSAGILQGGGLVKEVSKASIVSSLIGILTIVVLATFSGMVGWAIGKYIAEAFLALVLLSTLRRNFVIKRDFLRPARAIASSGLKISSALLARSLVDNSMLPAMLLYGLSAADVGEFGLGSLLVFPALLIPGVIGNVIIPKFSLASGDASALRSLLVRSVTFSVLVAVIISLLIAVIAPYLVGRLYPEYADSIGLLMLLLLCAPIRAAPIPMGGLLLALKDYSSPLYINLLCLGVMFVLAAVLMPTYGVVGAAIAMIGVELVSLLGFSLAAKRALNFTVVKN
jgi:O-antigen/teichoic acid export membrane protein